MKKLAIYKDKLFVLAMPVLAQATEAQSSFASLQPSPATGASTGGGSYFVSLYNWLIQLAIVLAIAMIVVGGVQYAASGISPSQKADAKNRIVYAIGGLILALASALILGTIDPSLVNPTILS